MPTSSAGDAGTPPWRKPGFATGRRLVIRMAPPAVDELLAGAPEGVTRLPRVADFDIPIGLVTARAGLDRSLQLLLPHLRPHGMTAGSRRLRPRRFAPMERIARNFARFRDRGAVIGDT